MRPHPALPLAERIKRAAIRTRPKGKFTRFTDRARTVIVLAQDEARELGHGSRSRRAARLGRGRRAPACFPADRRLLRQVRRGPYP